jgi:hypothetical protein
MPPRVYAVHVPAMPMRVDTKSGLGQKERVNVLSALIAYRCASSATEHIARRTHTFTVSPEPRLSGSELPRNNRSATKRGQWHILDTAVTIGDCRAEPPHCTHYYATRTRHAARRCNRIMKSHITGSILVAPGWEGRRRSRKNKRYSSRRLWDGAVLYSECMHRNIGMHR